MLKSYMAIVAIVAAVLLAGCATTTSSQQSSSAMQIIAPNPKNASKPKPMTSIPASLGLLAPQVANYQCKGVYYPATREQPTQAEAQSEFLLPYWQLTIRCVNPKLKFNLPQGTMRAGMVWVMEQAMNAPSLRQAMLAQRPVSDLKVSSVGKLRVETGRLPFGSYTDNVLWFFGGKTTWMGFGKQQSGTVFVYLTGRALPMSTLKQFAESMQPLSR